MRLRMPSRSIRSGWDSRVGGYRYGWTSKTFAAGRQQIKRIIDSVDYFVFVQSDTMDQRDQRREDGVYNWELQEALARQKERPYGAVFLLHVTLGSCRDRPEPQLAELHRTAIDTDLGVEKVVEDILKSHDGTRNGSKFLASQVVWCRRLRQRQRQPRLTIGGVIRAFEHSRSRTGNAFSVEVEPPRSCCFAFSACGCSCSFRHPASARPLS